jgi:phosphodiesterase/alkaline phosphatase D-like protein
MMIGKHMTAALAALGALVACMALADAPALAAPVLPVVKTEAVSNLTLTSATLNATVNPKGTSVSECQFEIGPYAEWLYEVLPCSVALPLTGASSVPVSVALAGLSPSGVYYYRVSAGNETGTSQGAVLSFTTPPAVEGVSTLAATAIGSHEAMLNGSLEPNGLDAHYFFEYGVSNSYGSNTNMQDAGTQSEPTPVSAPVVGLTPDQSYHFRLVAENSAGTTYGADETFLTQAVQPVVEQSGATVSVARSSALLSFVVNSENSATDYQVEYGSSTAYGARSATAVRSTDAAESINIGLEDLTPATQYHYRLVASNSAGTVAGPDETFTTSAPSPPLVATGGASAVGQSSATVAGSVNSQGLPTNYGFELGTGSGYGPPTGIGTAGGGEEAIALTISGLAPGTTYHYRVLASNQDGTVYGADETFTTSGVAVQLAVPAAAPLIAAPAVAFPALKVTASQPKSRAKAKRKIKKKKRKPHKRKATAKR